MVLCKDSIMKIETKKEFYTDYISREAGEKLRQKIAQQLQQGSIIELDFANCMIASTSFFDEGIAKLALEFDDVNEKAKLLKIKNLHRRDHELLLSLCERRKLKIL